MTPAPLEIPRIREPMRIHNLLRRRLRLPHPLVDRIVAGLRVARNPRDRWRRARALGAVGDPADGDRVIPRKAGCLTLGPGALPGQDRAVAAAAAAYRDLEANGGAAAALEASNKPFLVNLLRDRDFLGHPEVFRFAVSRPVVDAAARYLRTIPLLSTIRLWWTPPNTTVESSQLYHCDAEGPTQLKLFFNVTDVGPDAGPLTVIPADASAPVLRTRGSRRGKLPDEVLAGAGVLERRIVLTGPPGTGAAVDTSRCLHLGSRGNTVDRVILMVQFTPTSCPRGAAPSWGEGIAAWLEELDPVQRLVLNLAGASPSSHGD